MTKRVTRRAPGAGEPATLSTTPPAAKPTTKPTAKPTTKPAAGTPAAEPTTTRATTTPAAKASAALRAAQPIELQRSSLARLFGASPLSVDGQQWFSDALGDMAVGALLARLGAEWRVLHAVPSDAPDAENADIDHVVIGPPGVFTINTRNHAGEDVWVDARTVMVAGSRFSHIRDSEHGLGRAERMLQSVLDDSIVIAGLLVIIDPRSLTIDEMPRDLHVLGSGELLDWLAAQPAILTPDDVLHVAAVAESADTWWRDHGLVDAPETASTDFANLRHRVERARMLRELWVGTFTIVVIVTAAALGSMAVLNLLPVAAH